MDLTLGHLKLYWLMGAKYHDIYKYFGEANGIVFGIIKMCKSVVINFVLGLQCILHPLCYFNFFGRPCIKCNSIREYQQSNECLKIDGIVGSIIHSSKRLDRLSLIARK